MAVVLGLHYGHGGSVCVVKDGKLIGALASERLVGEKFSHGVYDSDIDYLLGSLNLTLDDIDYVGLSDWNRKYAWNDITVDWVNFKDGNIYRTCNGLDGHIECLWNEIFDNVCLELNVKLRGKSYPGFYIGHQLAHASSAYYTSPYDKSYCFTMDASGGRIKANSLVAYGEGNKLTSLYCPGLMIGLTYGFFTEFLGLGSQIFKAGTTMALAGYGEIFNRVLNNKEQYINDCFFDPIEGDYHPWYSNLWCDLHGNEERINPEDSASQEAMNIAATTQYIFQEAILKCVNEIDSGDVKNICLSGGSMLNCTANSLILTQSKFNNVHLFPGCGDDGGSVGVALYIAHHILDEPRYKYKDHEICYLGVERQGIEPDYQYLAKKLEEGKIIAWFNGKSEYGPRALGNRSLFADPRTYKNFRRLNFEIKDREWFRPLAPIVMEEFAEDWFDFPVKSPFMLFTMSIKYPDLIPAVNHIDRTSRIQTVTEESNPYCYRLIDEFRLRTKMPILINTSLNQNGQPILETKKQAFEFFNKNVVDIMVLDGEVFEK